MVMITMDLPEDLNNKVRHYCIDNKIKDKRIAIVNLLETYFEGNK